MNCLNRTSMVDQEVLCMQWLFLLGLDYKISLNPHLLANHLLLPRRALFYAVLIGKSIILLIRRVEAYIIKLLLEALGKLVD